ncbi:MAG: Sapep family Mn(2+)-dependent dipeptidase [Fimbriimonas ginsengisoli]|uniref:Sapep family Mn(2+)-dependent dipeptidase n=1 Tax=Fimbriimonas ginsengisoli TaxID=1005039 RepID=A0A931LV17_FIMGI|nr:Sapep family Mn(2+)-dependent dipeptidase [Fimbriimonas ginsengisoli]
MGDAVVERLHRWLREHESELLEDTRAMLRIPSIEGTAAPNAPFGAECRQALDLALEMSGRFGMKTKDLEGFVGYAEIGQGPRMFATLGHLDVVPVGPGWKHEPFGAEVDGGYIYARGAEDDKGPTIASLYAVRALKECVPDLPARVRQIFGCNEESGFQCVEHYLKVDETPTLAVSPDAGWPLYHGEKGIYNPVISASLPQGSVSLLEVCGGQRINIVPDSCEARVRVAAGSIDEVRGKLDDAWDANVRFDWEGVDTIKIRAHGKAAHAATPFLGDSALTRLFRFLYEISPLDVQPAYEKLLDLTHNAGAGLGLIGTDDETGDLTANVGIVDTADGRVRLHYSVRAPMTWTEATIHARVSKRLAILGDGIRVDEGRFSPGLFFPLDHPLVSTILEVYREETGDMAEPGVMGGGTYARAFPNAVSIGSGWEGDGKAHETDERLKIENLFKMSRIYAHLYYRLATVAAGLA